MELIFSLAAATALGLLTGLGVGGGSLLLLYLTGFLSLDPSTARSISLLFFFPAALLSGFRNRKKVPYGSLLPAVLPGILAAALFSLLSQFLDPAFFRKALGGLFIFTGLRELLPDHKKSQVR